MIQTSAMARRMTGRLEDRAKLGDGGFLQNLLDALPDNFFADMFAGFLLSMFNCDFPSDGRDAKETVERNHKGDGRYDKRFFARTSRIARREARKLGESLTRKQSHAVTQVALDEIRGGDEHEMSLVITEQSHPQR